MPLVKETKFLRVWLDNEVSWNLHVNKLSAKLKRNLHLLRNQKNLLDLHTLKLIHLAQIQSHINYRLVLWGGMASSDQLNKIKKTQNKCMKIIKPKSLVDVTFHELKLLNLDQLIDLENKKLGYKISKKLLPKQMLEIINCDQNDHPLQKTHSYNTRKKKLPNICKSCTKCYQSSFPCNGIRALNKLNLHLLESSTIKCFMNKCKKQY